MQKLIVTSATYRQASKLTPELLEKDPENRLLARGPRLRLAAEAIRDQALVASGLLVEKLGGPSRASRTSRRASGRKSPAAAAQRTDYVQDTARRCTAAACTRSGSAPCRRRR